jgi:hypothetical protein
MIETRKINAALDQLWRFVPRVMDCLPSELFGTQHLEYAEDDKVTVGNTTRATPLWAATFCETLRLIVVHPIFQRSPKLLGLVLQYAVKLRTNNRRRWPLQHPTADGFLDDLAVAFNDPHPDQTIKAVHQGVRRAHKSRGNLIPVMSRLLRELEVEIEVPEAVSTLSAEPFEPYQITTPILKSVVKTLDKMRDCGTKVYSPPDFTFHWVKAAMRSRDVPHGVDGVTRALQLAHRISEQRVILQQRRAAHNPAGGHGNVVEQEDADDQENSVPNSAEAQDQRDATAIPTSRIQDLEAKNRELIVWGWGLEYRKQELEHRNQELEHRDRQRLAEAQVRDAEAQVRIAEINTLRAQLAEQEKGLEEDRTLVKSEY